jgi:hypothetical protein
MRCSGRAEKHRAPLNSVVSRQVVATRPGAIASSSQPPRPTWLDLSLAIVME